MIHTGDAMKASTLKNHEQMIITAIQLSQADSERLFYLGIYVGGLIEFVQQAPMHDPLLFYVRGNLVILRLADAANIEGKVVIS